MNFFENMIPMDGPYKESKLPLLGLQKPFLNEAFDTREELRRPENNKLTFALILTVFAAAIGSSFQSGWHTGCVNPIGKVAYTWYNGSHHRNFGNYLSKSENTLAWSVTVGLFNLGGMLGGFTACRLADKIGRRNTLLANNAFICTGIFFMTFAKFVDFYLFLPIGRLITGTGSGIASAIVPMYLTEISPIGKRGALGSVHQLTFTFSNFIATIFGLPQIFGNTVYWPLIFAIALFPAIIQMVLLPLCPESPKFTLLAKRQIDQASKDLQKLRKSSNISLEIEIIQNEFAKNSHLPKIQMGELFTNILYRKRVIIAIMLMLALQFSGINAVFFYSRKIFEDAGLKGNLPFYATIFTGFLNFCMTVVAAKLMDHNCFGRRILHLIGLSGMFLSTIGIVVSMSFSQSTTYPNLQKFGSIGSVLFVFMYIISFATGPGPIPWFFVSEIFPSHAKSSAQSLAVMSCWIAGSIVGIAFLPINNILGHYSFLIFTAFLGWFIFFTYKHVPETKGKTVDEVERDMGLDIIKQ